MILVAFLHCTDSWSKRLHCTSVDTQAMRSASKLRCLDLDLWLWYLHCNTIATSPRLNDGFSYARERVHWKPEC